MMLVTIGGGGDYIRTWPSSSARSSSRKSRFALRDPTQYSMFLARAADDWKPVLNINEFSMLVMSICFNDKPQKACVRGGQR